MPFWKSYIYMHYLPQTCCMLYTLCVQIRKWSKLLKFLVSIKRPASTRPWSGMSAGSNVLIWSMWITVAEPPAEGGKERVSVLFFNNDKKQANKKRNLMSCWLSQFLTPLEVTWPFLHKFLNLRNKQNCFFFLFQNSLNWVLELVDCNGWFQPKNIVLKVWIFFLQLTVVICTHKPELSKWFHNKLYSEWVPYVYQTTKVEGFFLC